MNDPASVTVIVGAGPAGLATAACLTRLGLPWVLLEQSDRAGVSWHRHYDRLHLHTDKNYSGLPHRPFPKSYPRFPSRQQVCDYLTDYARHFAIEPRFGCRVGAVRQEDGRWTVETDGETFSCEQLVIASGYNRTPWIPHWPGQEVFAGRMLHSSEYRNGEPFRGQRVLVVGIGNTGGEIAIDLTEHGAAETTICVRSPLNVIPREVLGSAVQVTAIRTRWLPRRLRDWLGRLTSRIVFGDLAAIGLPPAAYGPATQVEKFGSVPLIDVGTVGLIRRGEISVVGGIQQFERGGAVFEDGARRTLDAVVLATGYRTGLAELLPQSQAVLDERGYPRTVGRESELPGLYFVGFSNPPSGVLYQIEIDARRVAQLIRAKLPTTPTSSTS